MAQIIGSGDPVNPALASFFDTSFDLSPFGLLDRFDFRSDLITRSDVGGTQRISKIDPVGTARQIEQPVESTRPEYLAGGGPSGLLDAASFLRSRADKWPALQVPAATQTRIIVLNAPVPDAEVTTSMLRGTPATNPGRNLCYLVRTAPTTMQIRGYAGVSPTVRVDVPPNTWVAVAMTVNFATREVSVGCRASGATEWVWGTGLYTEGSPPTQTALGFGGSAEGNGFTGRVAAEAIFSGYDIRTNAAMMTEVSKWLFGPNSVVGL